MEWLRRSGAHSDAAGTSDGGAPLERAPEITEASATHADDRGRAGRALAVDGRLRDAERLARTLLDGGPEPAVEVLVHTGLAGVLSMAARYPEAIDHLEQAAVAAPSPNASPWPLTGVVCSWCWPGRWNGLGPPLSEPSTTGSGWRTTRLCPRDYRRWRWWPSPTDSSIGPCPRRASGLRRRAQRGRVGQPPPVAWDRARRR